MKTKLTNILRGKERKRRKKKHEKKENSQNCKIKTVQQKIKYNRSTWPTKETKNYIYWNKTN